MLSISDLEFLAEMDDISLADEQWKYYNSFQAYCDSIADDPRVCDTFTTTELQEMFDEQFKRVLDGYRAKNKKT